MHAKFQIREATHCQVSLLFYFNFNLFYFSLKIETITCNKLSHCLFDFDCPNFDQYENEKYQHQIFKYYNLTSSSNELKMLSINDMSLFRKDMIITQDPNEPPTKRDSKFRIK